MKIILLILFSASIVFAGRSGGGSYSSGSRSGGYSRPSPIRPSPSPSRPAPSAPSHSSRNSGIGKPSPSPSRPIITSTRSTGIGKSVSKPLGYSETSHKLYLSRTPNLYTSSLWGHRGHFGWGFWDYYIMYHILFPYRSSNHATIYQSYTCERDRDCLPRDRCDIKLKRCVERGW